jgi:putative ABC transport system substrate-binding protein
MHHVTRRQFVTASGALLVAPIARAQQTVRRPYRIAVVPDFGPSRAFYLKILTETLRESGRIEGRDYVIYHSGVFYDAPDAKLALERALEAKPDLVIVNNLGYAIDAYKRTKTIPIVMWVSGFPVEGGVAESLAKPGKNVTGFTIYGAGAVFGKLLELLHEAKPSVKRVGFFMSYVPPFHPRAEADLIIRGMRDAAGPLGLELRVFEIANLKQIDEAFASVVAQRIEALVLTSDPSIWARRKDITQFAIAKRLPTIIDSRWVGVEPQPLLAYRARFDILMRQAAAYVNRILWEGAKPGDLPIQLPAKFTFAVNLKTAKAIGLTIPQALLIQADEVIE